MRKIKVFVSGCYDIIHGGHIEFFTQAKKLGNYLIVSVANDEVLLKYKGRKSSLPLEHKVKLLQSLNMIDEVLVGTNSDLIDGLDFLDSFYKTKPDILVATEDDKFSQSKIKLCQECNWKCEYVSLPKTLNFQQVSTSEILNWIKTPKEVPLRVDFAGGWLDVPKYSRKDSYIVNCAITPMVNLKEWIYEIGGGLGGSAAYSILSGKNGIESELNMGVGWQDPAIIEETGLCVWESGFYPKLDIKVNPLFLYGHMALLWTGKPHVTFDIVNNKRNYILIKDASIVAKSAVYTKDFNGIVKSVKMSYQAQLDEGMTPLENYGVACKYCGSGFGGYALYLFKDIYMRNKFLSIKNTIKIEPYIK